MPILSIIEKFDYAGSRDKDKLAELILQELLEENPVLAQLNTSTLRNHIFRILNYNREAEGRCPHVSLRAHASNGEMQPTYSYVVAGQRLTLTARGQLIQKVCPKCSITANLGDLICPGCSHVYPHSESEEADIVNLVQSLGIFAGKSAELTASDKVILDDSVEGFKVTEGDVNRVLREVKKYIPVG